MSAQPIEPIPEPVWCCDDGYCRICGVDLENQHAPNPATIFQPVLLDSENPPVDELCDVCNAWAWIR